MRLHIGPVPDDTAFCPSAGGWRRLCEPSFGGLMLIAVPLGVLLAFGTLSAWGAAANLHGIEEEVQLQITPGALLVALGALVALVLAHELVHALVVSGFGLTGATILGFWPQKLTPYVSYEGELSRGRHILTGLMPVLLLTVLPLLVGIVSGWMPWWMAAASSLNALFSTGDLIGTVLLAVQAPRSAMVRNKGMETWWRAAG